MSRSTGLQPHDPKLLAPLILPAGLEWVAPLSARAGDLPANDRIVLRARSVQDDERKTPAIPCEFTPRIQQAPA